MRAILIGAALLTSVASVSAKDMAAGAECYVLGRTYGLEMNSLARLEKRKPFHRYERSATFVDVMFWPFAVINEHHNRFYDVADDAQYRRVSEVLSCGLQKGCEWAREPGADRSPNGRPIIRTECPA